MENLPVINTPELPNNQNNKALIKPDILTDIESETLKKQTTEAVKSLMLSNGSNAIEIASQIGNIGLKDQKVIADGMPLLQTKVAKIIGNGKSDTATAVSTDMTELQEVMAKINPSDVEKESYFKIISAIPFLGNKMVKILKTIALRRETLQQYIDHLKVTLEQGQQNLQTDNAQLMVIYKNIEGKQKIVVANAYQAELMRDALQAELVQITDPEKKHNIQRATLRASARAQDLWTSDNVNKQFKTSLQIVVESNEDLYDAVSRLLSIVLEVLYVSCAIEAALARAKDITELYNKTRDMAGNMLVHNAKSINAYVTEIGDIYANPAIAYEKLETSCNLLVEAITTMNKKQAENILKTRDNSDKIKTLTVTVEKQKGEVFSGEIKSIEASNVLSLPSPNQV